MQIRYLLPALLITCALLISPTQAQSDQSGSAYGVGVSFNGGTTFYVPMHFGSVRIEPELGFHRRGVTRDNADDQFNTRLRFGLGGFGTLTSHESADIYGGVRLGVVRKANTEGETTTTTSDFFVGPALGGEYFLSDHFSLGAEVAAFYTNVGRAAPDISEERIETNAQPFVRVYF